MAFDKVNFVGKLDGETVRTLQKKLDFTVNSLDERIQNVNGILDGTGFFTEYLLDYYSGVATTTSALSENRNVFKFIESMSSYILNSKEVKQEEDEEKLKYVFYRDTRYLTKKINKELNLQAFEEAVKGNSDGACNYNSGEDIIHFLVRDEKNVKKSKQVLINNKDISGDTEMNKVLQDYQRSLDSITTDLKEGNRKGERYILTRNKASIVEDMVSIKKSYLGIFGNTNSIGGESTDYNLMGLIDLGNQDHVKKLLRQPFSDDCSLSNDIGVILYDLNSYVKRIKLNKIELDILEKYKNGNTLTNIASFYNTSHVKILRYINSISKKISTLVTEEGGYL